MLNNIEQYLTIAVMKNIIDSDTHDSLLKLFNKEYPDSDIYKLSFTNQDIKDLLKLLKEEPLKKVLTFSEATTKYSLGKSTLRKNLNYNRYLEGEVRLSEGTWLITELAIKRLYPNKFKEVNGVDKE